MQCVALRKTWFYLESGMSSSKSSTTVFRLVSMMCCTVKSYRERERESEIERVRDTEREWEREGDEER